MKIEINNGRYLELCFGNKILFVKYYNSNGEFEKVEIINEGDIVSLINYYIYQKNNSKELI